jgi:hypothetical protein
MLMLSARVWQSDYDKAAGAEPAAPGAGTILRVELIMAVALIPFFAFREAGRVIGKRLLFASDRQASPR